MHSWPCALIFLIGWLAVRLSSGRGCGRLPSLMAFSLVRATLVSLVQLIHLLMVITPIVIALLLRLITQ